MTTRGQACNWIQTMTDDIQINTHKNKKPIMCLTSILIDPVQENVHGSCLGDLVVVSVQPEYLLTPELLRLILSRQTTSVVPTDTKPRSSNCQRQHQCVQAVTHPPSLQSPVPPFAARTYLGSAHRERPSELKYEPARQMMTYSKALVALFTPRLACDGETTLELC